MSGLNINNSSTNVTLILLLLSHLLKSPQLDFEIPSIARACDLSFLSHDKNYSWGWIHASCYTDTL